MRASRIFVLTAILICSACNTMEPQPDDPLDGDFRSIQYILPGPTDGAVDVQNAGGFVEATLAEGHHISGRIVIPENISPGFTPGETLFDGTYELNADTVLFRFNNPEGLNQSLGKMHWDAAKQTLETPGEMLGRGPFKLVLEKN